MFERIFETKIFNLNKAPDTYEPYECNLSDFHKKVAEVELNETDSIREQSLQLMREWIAKNPDIISCRTDALFLLRFLRVCKFSVVAACAKLEKYLHIRTVYKHFCENLSIDEPKIRELFEMGYIVPLPEKDHQGRQVLFFQTKKLVSENFIGVSTIRAVELAVHMLGSDDEVQVSGLQIVFDDTGLNMGHITMIPLQEIANLARYWERGQIIRLKSAKRVNVPSFALATGEMLLKFVKPKLRHRLEFARTYDDLHDFDKSVLPKEYGGKYPIQEITDAFIKVLENRKEEVLMHDKMKVLPRKCKEYEFSEIIGGINGSFRKLDID